MDAHGDWYWRVLGRGNSVDVTNRLVVAGQQYTLSESGGAAGYASNGVWSCIGGGTFVAPDKITVGNGENVSCTITNDDVAGTLVVEKVVINDNGGSMKATDFKFKVDGGSAVAFAQDGGNALAGKNTLSVSAGSHSVVEDALPIAGYTTTYSNCANVNVANGGTQTCTITNDDVAGTLVVKKVVINDNGGSMKATDFKFKVDGGSAVAFAQDGGNALAGRTRCRCRLVRIRWSRMRCRSRGTRRRTATART